MQKRDMVGDLSKKMLPKHSLLHQIKLTNGKESVRNVRTNIAAEIHECCEPALQV